MRLITVLLLLLCLPACATTGPGAACDDCAAAEATAVAPGPQSQAASAAATGGQRASNQPTMIDPGRLAPVTTWNRGAGNNSASQQNSEHRAQAGAPSVNQGLVLPTAADASTGGGVSPVLRALDLYAGDLRAQLALAVGQPGREAERDRLMAELREVHAQMAAVQEASRATVHNAYHLEGARIVQSVANGSKAGPGDAGAIDAEAARAVAEPTAEAVRGVMESPAPAGGQ